jgi:hypothetical protein
MSPSLCLSVTGFLNFQIHKIHSIFVSKDLLGLTRTGEKKVSLKPLSVSLIDLTIMFLIKIRMNPTFDFIESIFHFKFSDYFWLMCDLAYSWAIENLKKFSSKDLLNESVFFYGKQLVAIGDGTEQQVKEFIDPEESLAVFSGKKGFSSITKFCWVTPKGNLIKSTHSYRGALVDLNLLSQSKYMIDLPEKTFVGVDGGMKGIQKFYPNSILPVEKRKRISLTEDEKEWNNKFKRHRTVVENYFAAIKKFSILTDKFRFNGNLEEILSKHHQVFIICAAPMQKFLHPNGLRP